MTPPDLTPNVSFDGGDLHCGNGLLLLIRKHIDPLTEGGLLEICSRESSVKEDLPAWCRMTGNELVRTLSHEGEHRYLVCKGSFSEDKTKAEPESSVAPNGDRAIQIKQQGSLSGTKEPMPLTQELVSVSIPDSLPEPIPCPSVPPLAIMGIGSWPRPKWLIRAIHERMEGRLGEEEFQEIADDAVSLVLNRQEKAQIDVLTDGEQRRDNYSSFVGGILDNCQLIPLTDLLPYVDDPKHFAAELKALDVPASEVRHPAVFGPLGRSRPISVHELEFSKTQTALPIKVSLPGPYLLTRTMWMECISDRYYESRETLSRDVVRVLREELHELLHAGAALVQFDEPVLTEVAFAQSKPGRSFMCGALGEKLPVDEELAFAHSLFAELTADLPTERIAIHICRGNWSRDESLALQGSYAPLIDFLARLNVGNYFLEMCTPRAGELEILRQLPEDRRIGIGVVNQKRSEVESVEAIAQRIDNAIKLFGAERLMLTPDCGFATFADNPISSTEIAAAKLAAIVKARNQVQRSH